MSEPAVASTQYCDLQGTVSIDGHDGPFLLDLARRSKMPKGYFPIGLSIYGGAPLTVDGDSKNWRICVLAVDADIGGADGSLLDYARTVESVPAFRFSVEISMQELLSLMKRLDIVALYKGLGGKPVKILQDG